uniref:Melittin-related peptide AK-23-1 n=1 Tax=Rana arvalis TaxID=156871 RepID=MLP2_RANAR|nr:RecName: Full=Melittin-related peptide AK-23-1 [Rana arvalis]
ALGGVLKALAKGLPSVISWINQK